MALNALLDAGSVTVCKHVFSAVEVAQRDKYVTQRFGARSLLTVPVGNPLIAASS
jgi:hypothetical protein